MKKIKLTRGFEALVDDDDFIILNIYKWQALKSSKGPMWYARAVIGGKYLSMHRFIMNAPDGWDIDHKDRNGLNNQKENLRIGTRSQNMGNQTVRINNKLGIKGVSRRGNLFVSQIQKDGHKIHLGYYKNSQEASEAYRKASVKYYGEFSRV